MMRFQRIFGTALVAAATGFAGPASRAAPPALTQAAEVHAPFRGTVPAHSDVIVSSRFERPEAPSVMRAFGATRVEWVYAARRDYVEQLKAAAPHFGGGIRTSGKTLPTDGLNLDFDGKVAIVPRMQRWGGELLTSNAPASQQYMRDTARQMLDWGARSLHFDNPLLQYFAALYLGGDFHPASIAGFPAYLKTHPDQKRLAELGLQGFAGDYRDYLRARQGVRDAADYAERYRKLPSNPVWLAYMRSSVRQRYAEFRDWLKTQPGGPVPVSMNLSNLYEPSEQNHYFFLAEVVDYAMAETQIRELPQLLSQAATLRALGVGWAPSIRPLSLAENRVGIATLYALGGTPVVPWDVYVGNDDEGRGQRYFGKPEEYGDLYRFVRAHAELFDGLESTPVVGIPVPVDRFLDKPTRELVAMLVERRIPFAYVPLGGSTTRYHADPARLRHFRLLVTPNPDRDFRAEDLAVLTGSGVPRTTPEALRKSALDELQPFFAAPGGESLRIMPRAIPGNSRRLVLHVVDASRGDVAPAEPSCRRRIGVSRTALDAVAVESARWVTPDGSVELKPDPTGRGTFFTLPGCPLWGIVEMRLRGQAR